MPSPHKLLILYTGGTIGMQMSENGLVPAGGFEARLRAEQQAHIVDHVQPEVHLGHRELDLRQEDAAAHPLQALLEQLERFQALLEQRVAEQTAMHFSKALRVRMSLGSRSSRTISTMRLPVRYAASWRSR